MKRIICIVFLLAAALHQALAIDLTTNEQNGNIGVYWNVDDMCGVFTVSGTEIAHWATSDGDSICTLSAYGWSLSPDTQYYAYFPFSQSYSASKASMTALPISYLGQTQRQNASMAHLTRYDFMTAQSVSTDVACHFSFQHLGCILAFQCDAPHDTPLQSLTLSADSACFITAATIDAVSGALTPTAGDSAVTLLLDGISIPQGNRLSAYMMLPPIDLTGDTLTLTLTTTDGTTSTALIVGTDLLPGHIYPIVVDNSKDNTDEQAPTPASIKARDDERMANSLTALSITTPTASAPDFIPDDEHAFEHFIPEPPENPDINDDKNDDDNKEEGGEEGDIDDDDNKEEGGEEGDIDDDDKKEEGGEEGDIDDDDKKEEGGEEGGTAIKGVSATVSLQNPVYTLSGQRTAAARRGRVYIRNGKKVIKR